jgi:microcystin-dependent protein
MEQSTEPERPAPPSTTQAMQHLVATAGNFPGRGQGDPALLCMGMVHSFAGTSAAFGAPNAEGQLIWTGSNPALYSIFFTTFGFGSDDFGLPALKGRTMTGGTVQTNSTATTQPMTWIIAASPEAGSEAPLIGSLAAFGGVFIPDGWLACDGRMMAIEQNVALYEAIGNSFGGANLAFQLPDLSGPTALVGAGAGGAVGSTVPGPPAGLCFTYLINVSAPPPAAGGDGAFPSDQYWLGQVIAYAGSAVPPGWALADGSLLTAAAYPELFALLGATYGGDGKTIFKLPDLRGKMAVGT